MTLVNSLRDKFLLVVSVFLRSFGICDSITIEYCFKPVLEAGDYLNYVKYTNNIPAQFVLYLMFYMKTDMIWFYKPSIID